MKFDIYSLAYDLTGHFNATANKEYNRNANSWVDLATKENLSWWGTKDKIGKRYLEWAHENMKEPLNKYIGFYK